MADRQMLELAALYGRWFGARTDGSFVEVGAYDGETLSNTACLADRGWRGLYVEPVPDYAVRCRRRHARNPRVLVAECAVGAAAGTVELQVRGLLSGIAEGHQRAFDVAGWAAGFPRERRIKVPQQPLDAVLEAATIAPGFELLVVDVEGYEAAVFEGFDIARWRPTMMIVELCDGGQDYSGFPDLAREHAGVRARLLAAGYAAVHVDSVDTVFVSARAEILSGR
jgi:FkbM family methyltransferase